MSTMVQIRNIPEAIHRALKARAALAGQSLSDFVRAELVAMARLPSEAELRARLASAKPFEMKRSSAGVVRRVRDAA